MREINLNIIDFVRELGLLLEAILSVAQRTILKVTYGLSLDESEREFYRRATGREEYRPREHDELSVLAGRQSGKTSCIAAPIAVFEAFREHGVPPGQRAYVLVIAPVIQQAKIAFNFIRKYIEASTTLSEWVLKITQDEIELKNGVVIACRPCSYITVRGYPIIAVICDEMAFWRHEVTAANPEQEVIDALRPGMATLHHTKLVKISTPYRKEGILWNEFQQRNELDHVVWQVSTEEMNPAVPRKFLEKARRRSEETFRREHLAEFTDNAIGWIAPEILDPCIFRGKNELPRVSLGRYAAAADPAFRSSDFGFAVLHRSDDGDITVVYVYKWTGTRNLPLDFEIICAQIQEVLLRYGINELVGDQFCFPILRQQFEKLGIYYREFTFGSHTRASLYGNLRQLISQRKITLLDEPELLRQLRNLEEVKVPNGVDVRPPRAQKDDMAISVAIAAYELSHVPDLPPGPFLIDRDPPGIVSSCSPYEMPICSRFPRCWDRGQTCECMP